MAARLIAIALSVCLGALAQSDELYRAVVRGDVPAIAAFAQAGADLRSPDGRGATLLHYAILFDRTEAALFLMSQKVDINATWSGSTPLDVAVARGNVQVARALIDRGVDIHRTFPTGRTALHLAALNDKTEVARLLIERGADVNARDKQGVASLDEAVLRGFSDFVKLLLEAGADPNADNRRTGATPLNEAVYKNQTKIIELLLAHHANSTIKDKSGFSPLANAVRFDHAEAARLLATQATTANSRYEQLQEAIAKGSRPMIVLLLENGADINATFGSGSSPLDLAARQGRDEIVELLLAKGADLDAHDQAGATPLHNAALSGHAAIVGILLDHGANIDGQEIESGATPLYLAVYLGRDDVVQLLLDRGANPNTCNKAGASPLRAAVAEENKSIAAAIMARGGRETCNQR